MKMKRQEATYIIKLKDGSYFDSIIEDSEKISVISYCNNLNAKTLTYDEALHTCMKIVKQLKDIEAVTMEESETI